MSNPGHAVRKSSLKGHQHLHHPYSSNLHHKAVDNSRGDAQVSNRARQQHTRTNSGHAHLLQDSQATPTGVRMQSTHPLMASSSNDAVQTRAAQTSYTPIAPMHNASAFASASIHTHVATISQKYPAWPQANPASIFDLEDKDDEDDEEVSPTAAPPSPLHTDAHAHRLHWSQEQHHYPHPQTFSTSPLLSDLGTGFHRMAMDSDDRRIGRASTNVEGFDCDYHQVDDEDAVRRSTSFVLDDELLQSPTNATVQDDRVKWW